MPDLLVLIADIKSSRDVEGKEREKLQQKLEDTLDELNKEGKGVLSPYTVTLGDEFQAVFEKADAVFVHILKIMAAMHPIKVRFSLSVGEISTPVNTEQAIGMDGPAFHKAREGIDKLKESDFLFRISTENDEDLTLKIINNSLKLLSKQILSWNKNRIIILHMLKEGYDYKEIIKTLDISRTAFYKNKDAGLLDVIDELSENMAEVINKKISL